MRFFLVVAGTLAASTSWAWEPPFGSLSPSEQREGLSVICELHGAEPSKDRDDYWLKVPQMNPSRLVFKARAVISETTYGEVYLERDGVRLSTLSEEASWLAPEGISWRVVFDTVTKDYMAEFDLPTMNGLFYQSSTLDERYKVGGFLDECQFIPKTGLPAIVFDE